TYTVRSFDGAGAFGEASGLVPTAGGEGVVDIVLIGPPGGAARIEGRVFLEDGASPATGVAVYVGDFDRQQSTIKAVGATTADAAGSFAFDSLAPRLYDVVAVDLATQQLGRAKVVGAAGGTVSVAIIFEATGAVEGVVLNAQGQP